MVDERKLPALPQPFGYIDSDGGFTPADSDDRYSMGDVFTANQMRAYAIEAAEQRVREVEAKLAASPVVTFWHGYDQYGVTFDGDTEAEEMEAANQYARKLIGTGWRVRLVLDLTGSGSAG